MSLPLHTSLPVMWRFIIPVFMPHSSSDFRRHERLLFFGDSHLSVDQQRTNAGRGSSGRFPASHITTPLLMRVTVLPGQPGISVFCRRWRKRKLYLTGLN